MSRICCLLLLAGAALATTTCAASAAEVRATRLDGTAVVGELVGWFDREVAVQTADGEQRIPTKELISLRWPQAPADQPMEKSDAGVVELTDGTVLPTTDYVASGQNATLTLDAPLARDERKLSVPLRQVAAVRSRRLESQAAVQWEEIRRQNLPSDVVVVLKRNGQSLDYVEGVLGDVSTEKITFRFDDDPLSVDRAKVAGLIYYRGTPGEIAEPRFVLHGGSGLIAQASAARVDDGTLHVTTAGGVSLRWPLSDIHFADFSAGKIVYLSDIEPAAEEWTPLVALPAGLELAAELGKPRRDQSAYGGSLALEFSEDGAPASLRELRSFEKGLAVRSHTELVYRLPGDFRRFVAVAGIEPATSAVGNVRLMIHADDQPLFDTEIRGDQPPHNLDLDVSGVKRLKIVVDFGQNLDTGDWLNLCDARLVK